LATPFWSATIPSSPFCLQRVDHAQRLVGVAAERQVVHELVADDAVLVDQEGAAQCDTLILDQHVIVARDRLRDVGHHRELHRPEAAILRRRIAPGIVAVLAVHAHRHDLHLALGELRHAVRIGEDLRRADEGEIERIEEDEAVAALQVGLQIEVVDHVAIGEDGCGGEIGGGLADENAH